MESKVAENDNATATLQLPQQDGGQAFGSRRNSAQSGLKLSLEHIQKYKLDEDLLTVQNYSASDFPKKVRRLKTRKEKKDKEYYKQKYPGYTSDDIEFLEADFGGDDEDPKFNYSLTGSDIQMNPISEDGDKRDKMRHLEQLREQEKALQEKQEALRKQKEAEAKKKTYKTAKVQTDRVPEFEVYSDSEAEYVAPPTPSRKETEEDSKEFEYDAASDFVDKHIQMGKETQVEDAAVGDDEVVVEQPHESSEDLEYQAPPDKDDFMGMTEREYDKYVMEQQNLNWFEKQEAINKLKDVVVQAEVVDLGQQAEQDEKELKKDVKMKTKALQADLDASVDNMKNALAAKLKEKIAVIKKQNKKELAIQANLEGESLNAAAKEKEEQLERQRQLREKKQKLKEALENEQKLKDEKEKQRRAQSKLNKKNLMQNKKKIRQFQEQLKEQNQSQLKQTVELNEKIQEMHEKYRQEEKDIKMEEEFNLQQAQQEVDELAKEAYKKMQEEWKSSESEKDGELQYDENGVPIVKRKDKRGHRGKLNYDMNVQTEGNIDDALFEHPVDVVMQNQSQYSPQPFKEIKSSIDEHEEKNRSSRLSLQPTGIVNQNLQARKQSIYSNDKINKSPGRLQRSPTLLDKDHKVTLASQKSYKSPTRYRDLGLRRSNEQLDSKDIYTSSRKQSYAPELHSSKKQDGTTYMEKRKVSYNRDVQLDAPSNIHSRKQSNPFAAKSQDLTNDIDDLSYQRARQNPAIADYMKQASPDMKRGSIPSTSGIDFQDDNFADQIGFADSVSQRQVDQSEQFSQANLDMKGKPFASNLENAKILAQVTKRRIENLDLGADHFVPPTDGLKELEKQKKANMYLNETLKHLNTSVDILVNQYDPAKLKQVKQATDKYSQLIQDDSLPKEDQEALTQKLNEIRNAEKQMKSTAKELQGLQKKYDRVKDWKHLSDLYKQTEEDQRKIKQLERDNKKLRSEQKKAEFKIAKQMKNTPENLAQEELNHSELLELDNEYKMLRHKADYLQEKLFKEQEAEREQQRLLNELKQKVKYAEQEEQKISETGRRLYKIDFDDVEKLNSENVQGELSKQKDKIMKKMVILEDGKASIDKQYAQQHRKNMQKMQQLNELKKQMEEQLKYNDQMYQEKQQQLKFYQQQKKANDTLKKQRVAKPRESQAALSEPTRLRQYDPGNQMAQVSTPVQSQLGPHINKPFQQNVEKEQQQQQQQMNAGTILSQAPSSAKEHNLPTSTVENVRLSTLGTEEGDASVKVKNPDPGLKRDQIKSRAGSKRSASKASTHPKEKPPPQPAIRMENQKQAATSSLKKEKAPSSKQSTGPALTKARLEEFDNKQKLAQALAEQRQQTKSMAIEREEKEQRERQKSQSSQRAPASPALSKQSFKKESDNPKPNQLAIKNQKVSAPKMNIEDIAIIRETLAEDDLEELTALDLEKQNFKSNISGTGAAKSGTSHAAKNNKNSLIKLIDNMPQLERIDEVKYTGSDLKKSKAKTNESKAPQNKQQSKQFQVQSGKQSVAAKSPKNPTPQTMADTQKKQDSAPGRASGPKQGEQSKNAKGRQASQAKASKTEKATSPTKSDKKSTTSIHVDMRKSISKSRLDEDGEKHSEVDGHSQQDRQENANAPIGKAAEDTNSQGSNNERDMQMINNQSENSPRTQVEQDQSPQMIERPRVKSPMSQMQKMDKKLQ